MSWLDIYGHEWQKSFFQRICRSQRIAHAYLFFGPPRVGKETFALEFAKTLQCLRPQNEGSCGSCRSCTLFQTRTHPDLVILASSDTTLGIDRVREFVRNLSLKRAVSPLRVGIVSEAEKLTEEAGNCLLKTVEEPPADSIIILITSRLWSILPTIISRTQLVEFLPLSENEVKRYLLEKEGLEEKKAIRIASLAMGSIGRALDILQGKESHFQDVVHFWKAIQNGEEISSLGRWLVGMELDKMIHFFSLLECYLRDVLCATLLPAKKGLFWQELWSQEARDDARVLNTSLVMGVIQLLEELIDDLLSYVQPEIAIVDFLGKVRGEMEHAVGSRSTVRG